MTKPLPTTGRCLQCRKTIYIANDRSKQFCEQCRKELLELLADIIKEEKEDAVKK